MSNAGSGALLNRDYFVASLLAMTQLFVFSLKHSDTSALTHCFTWLPPPAPFANGLFVQNLALAGKTGNP
jgi:hypothetical protein